MEDYVWILILGAFWLFEIVGKAIKAKGKTEDGELDASRPDPRRSSRELSREIDSSARRAEDALQRWEARQGEVVPVPARPVVDRRADKIQRRREAFEAIASMLAAPPERTHAAQTTQQTAVAVRDQGAVTVSSPRRVRPLAAEVKAPPHHPIRRSGLSGIGRLSGLTEIQRAVVLSEILGPPVSLAKKTAFHQDPD